MKKYKLIDNIELWGAEAKYGEIITEDELTRLADEWDKDVDELIDDLEEVDQYILFDDCGEELFTDEYETEADAIADAERVWSRLTKYDKKRRDAFYVGFGTVDNHDVVREWK